MYDRRYDGRVLGFEPSGGLMNASLVMRDRETDSWWSMITGDAIGGDLEGTSLIEMPVGEKIQFGEWKRRYPETLVLSVDGMEHDPSDPYDRYFKSAGTFRDVITEDDRLEQKQLIYAFQMDGMVYAVPHDTVDGGRSFIVSKEKEIFLYRVAGWSHFASTFAYVADREGEGNRFRLENGEWTDTFTGASFSEKTGFGPMASDGKLARLDGFDTYWYIWSATHASVGLLE